MELSKKIWEKYNYRQNKKGLELIMKDKIPFKKRLALAVFNKWRTNQIKEHKLTYLFWECTLRCNLRCEHCGSSCEKETSIPDMPGADFLKVIDQILPHVNPNKTMIAITGGEPLLRNDLEFCGEALYQRGFPWGIVSNGMLLTEKRFQSLLNAGMRSITISLDGFEEAHNKMRKHPQSFKNAVSAIQHIVANQEITYDIASCVTPLNFADLESFKEFLIKLGIKNWRIFTISPIGRATNNHQLVLSNLQYKQLLNFIVTTRKEGRIHLTYECEGFLGNYEAEVRDGFFFCRAGVNVGSVLVDGSISACPDLRGNFIQGNIYQDNFMDVWEHRYQAFRDRKWMKTGICRDCKSFKYCQGNGMHLRNEEGKLAVCHLQKLLLIEN